MATILDCAALADDVYADMGAPGGWARVEAAIPGKDWTGFAGAAYLGPQGALAIAFRGTEFGKDFVRDVVLADILGVFAQILPISQVDHAEKFAKSAIAVHGATGKPVHIVGHSLGGALVQLVAGQLKGTIGVTFNAPGVSFHMSRALRKIVNKDGILNIRAAGDAVSKPLSALSAHIGARLITLKQVAVPGAAASGKVMKSVSAGFFVGLQAGPVLGAAATAAMMAPSVVGGALRAHGMATVIDALKNDAIGNRMAAAILAG